MPSGVVILRPRAVTGGAAGRAVEPGAADAAVAGALLVRSAMQRLPFSPLLPG
jgi:hypothetical protein